MRTILIAAALLITHTVHADPCKTETVVCFSPGNDCNKLVADHILKAKKSVELAVYYLTDPVVLDALKKAEANKKVSVDLIIDEACISSKYCQGYKDIHSYWVDRTKYAIMHNKFIIIDGKVLITGSMNLTKSGADRNFENTVVITDPKVVLKYKYEFERMWRRLTEAYTTRPKPEASPAGQ